MFLLHFSIRLKTILRLAEKTTEGKLIHTHIPPIGHEEGNQQVFCNEETYYFYSFCSSKLVCACLSINNTQRTRRFGSRGGVVTGTLKVLRTGGGKPC